MTTNQPPQHSSTGDRCWICGSPATTREHLIKSSDIRAIFGKPTQQKPLLVHSSMWRNKRVAGLKSNLLKFPPNLCEHCNSSRTQPYDRAWQVFSDHLRAIHSSPGPAPSFVRTNRVFPHDTRRQLVNVHLFFVKMFGCRLAHSNLKIDLASFAESIKKGVAHPDIYLEFLLIRISGKLAHVSDIECAVDNETGKTLAAAWVYQAGTVGARVMYAAEGQERAGMKRSWHARASTTKVPVLNEEINLERLLDDPGNR